MGVDAAASEHLNFLDIFAKGSQVEVSSDEEGFKGAWYVATIIDPPSKSGSSKKKPQKLYVEYHSLLDEDGSKPLREYVNLAFVRPSPPSDSEKLQSFELNDAVDAFYRDGWWTGVITRVLDNSRVVVTFQNPPDVIEFGVSDLRVHREWVDEKWVRPEKQRTRLMFSAGKKVEVSFEKKDYRDVWFPAIVLEETGNGSFLVEYKSTGINAGPEHLKIIVDFLHIRPSPPHLKDTNFLLLEKVDAFYDFGWWSGVITKELADSRYVVFFKPTNKEREFNHSEIRPHMEWKDGNWFSASQDVLTSSDYQRNVRPVSYNVNDNEMAVSLGSSGTLKGNSEERTAVSMNSMENQIEQPTTCNDKASNAMTSWNKKTKLATPDTDDRHSRPSKKLKEANVTEAPSLAAGQLNTTQMEARSDETHFGFATSTNGNTETNSSEQPMVGDQPSVKTDNLSRVKKVEFFLLKQRSKRQKPSELDNPTPDVRRKGRPTKSLMSSSQASAGDKNDDAAGYTKEDFVEKECVSKEIDVPVTLNLKCTGIKGSRAKKPHQLPHEESLKLMEDQKQQLHDPTADRIKEGNQPERDGESIQKKKRGRPRKLLAKSPKASAAVKKQNRGVAADDMVGKDCIKNEVVSPTTAGMEAITMEGSVPGKEYMKTLGIDEKILNDPVELKTKSSSTIKVPPAKKDKLQNGKVVQASTKQHEKHSSKRGRRRTKSVNNESPIQDPQGVSVGKTAEVFENNCITKEVEMAIDKLPSNMSDDQPLSMWFEEMQSPKTVDASSVSQGRNVELCTEVSRRQKYIVMQSPAVDVMGGIVPVEDQSLPFLKNTPLWKTIESMEAFRMMPQKPHFRSLDSCKESSREGLAIGCMVTFVSMVEKTSSLQFDDPRSIIEDNLETLLELEIHGFDVKVLRDRLTGLLLIKDKQEELQDMSKEIENHIREHNHEKSKIDEEIDEIDKQICLLQEKRALALSTKEKKDSEIASLESTIEGINDGIRSAQLKFKGLVATPWQAA